MEIVPDQNSINDAQLPSTAFECDLFSELFGGELALSDTMPALPKRLPVWNLDDFGYTYDAHHVYPNGQINTGLYPPEYYEYDDLRACGWDEGLEAIESFDWSGTKKSAHAQDVQSTGRSSIDVSVSLGENLFNAEKDGSNIQQEELRASVQPENVQPASYNLMPELEHVEHSIVAPSSLPWIPTPLLAAPQLLHPTLSCPVEENEVEAEGSIAGSVPALIDSPSSNNAIDNLTKQNEHASAVPDIQSAVSAAAALPTKRNTELVASEAGTDGFSLENVSFEQVSTPKHSRWDGVMSRRDVESTTAFHQPQPQRFPNLRPTFALPADFDAHQAMLSLATTSTPYYGQQPLVQPATQHVPLGTLGEVETSHGPTVGDRTPLRHDFVAHSELALPVFPGNTTVGNNGNNPGVTQLPTNTPPNAVPDQQVPPPSVTVNHDIDQQLQNELEAAASKTAMAAEPHKHDDNVRQDSLVGPLAAGLSYSQSPMINAVSEQQLSINQELPPLPFRESASSLTSADSRNVSDANYIQEQTVEGEPQKCATTPGRQDIGEQRSMQTSIDVDQISPPTSAKGLTPSPMTIDANASAQIALSTPSPLAKKVSATRKRSKTAKKPDDISGTDEDAPARKKPKRAPAARSRAGTAAKKASVPPDEKDNAVVEQAQSSTPKPVKEELIDDEHTMRMASRPNFRVPNYTSQPERTSAGIVQRSIEFQLPFTSGSGFHQARSEDVAIQEGHFSDVERNVSPAVQPTSDQNKTKKPRGSLSRELRNMVNDTPLEEAVVPGPHLALHLQGHEGKADKASVATPAETSKIQPAFILVENDADAREEERLVDAEPSPTTSVIPKKRARAATKTIPPPKKLAASRKRATRSTTPAAPAVEIEEADSDFDENNTLFPQPKISSPSPPPTTPARIPPLNFNKTHKDAPIDSTHPFYPGYDRRTTRSDSRTQGSDSGSHSQAEEDGDDEAYFEPNGEALDVKSEGSVVETTKKKAGKEGRKVVKKGVQQEVKNKSVAAAALTPAKKTNKFGFKESPRRTRATTAAVAKGKAPAKKTARKGGAAANKPVENGEASGLGRRQTRQASMAASELREAEEKAANVKLRLRSRDGEEGGK